MYSTFVTTSPRITERRTTEILRQLPFKNCLKIAIIDYTVIDTTAVSRLLTLQRYLPAFFSLSVTNDKC